MAKPKQIDYIKISIFIVAGIFLITIGFYIWNFHYGISNKIANWQLYATLLSPFITFFSILLLYQSLRTQTKQFEKEYNKENLIKLYQLINSVFKIYYQNEIYILAINNVLKDKPEHLIKTIRQVLKEVGFEQLPKIERDSIYDQISEIDFLAQISIKKHETKEYVLAYRKIIYNSLFILFESLESKPYDLSIFRYYRYNQLNKLRHLIQIRILDEVSPYHSMQRDLGYNEIDKIMNDLSKSMQI